MRKIPEKAGNGSIVVTNTKRHSTYIYIRCTMDGILKSTKKKSFLSEQQYLCRSLSFFFVHIYCVADSI